MANGKGKNKRRQRVTKSPMSGFQQNTLKQEPLLVAVQLKFTDPDGEIRAFPKDFPVLVKYGNDEKTENRKIDNDEGNLIFTVPRAEAIKYKFFRLHFSPADNNNILCEKRGETKKTTVLANTTTVNEKSKDGQRFFRIPSKWSFVSSDWEVTADEKVFNKAAKEKSFQLLEDSKPRNIGTRTEPVKTLLNLHWQYVKFEYFDRYYGHSDHNNKPIGIPQMILEGFFKAKAGDTKDEKSDTRSNWTILQDNDEKKVIQCLPWILQAKENGTAEAKPDKDIMLQFKQPKDTYIISKSATERNLKTLVAPVASEDKEALKPCANRLKYYDLPELWKSMKYWCRLSDKKEDQGFFDKMAEKKTEKAKPLIFSLDDIVLTDDQIAPIRMFQTDKIVLFYHEFLDAIGDANKRGTGGRDGAKYLKNGLYKPGPDEVQLKIQAKEEKDARDKAIATKKKREEESARSAAEEKATKEGLKRAEIKKAGDDAVAAVATDPEAQKRIKEVGDKAAAQATKKALSDGKLKESTENLEVLILEPTEAANKARNQQKVIEEKPYRDEATEKQRKIEESKARKDAESDARKLGLKEKDIKEAGNQAVLNVAKDKDAQNRIKTAAENAATNVFSNSDAQKRITKARVQGYTAALAFPYSDVKREEDVPNYIYDYPHWSRLVVYNGNLFDVFHKRTKTGDVIGARAAVRWVDATSDGIGVEAGAEINPRPDFTPTTAQQDEAFFIIQPYFEQQFFSRSTVGYSDLRPKGFYDEWTTAAADDDQVFKNSRTDMAILRTSNFKDSTNEENVIFRFHRLSFDFTAEESLLNPTAPPPDIEDKRVQWLTTFVKTCADRWNGNDNINTSRAWIVEDKPAIPKVRSQVITFVQRLDESKAHFHVKTIKESGTSSMNAGEGTGKLRVNAGRDTTGESSDRGFAAAHEIGHCGGQPDDYAPDDHDQTAFGSNHITGAPFNLDTRSMMFYNRQVRARSYWHIADWMRKLNPFTTTKFQVEHGTYNYKVPHYNHADRSGRNYTHWNVKSQIFYRPSVPIYYDTFLYFLGQDEYSQVVLPSQPDGILVVMFKMFFDFKGYTNNEDIITHIFSRVNQKIDNALNSTRVHAQFNLPGIDRGTSNTFEKCMLHFSPRFGVANSALSHLKTTVKTPPGGATAKNWYYMTGPTTAQGPFTEMAFHNKFNDNTITEDSEIISKEGATWGADEEAKNVPEFEAKFTRNVSPRTLDFRVPADPGSLGAMNPCVTRLANEIFKNMCKMLNLSDKSSDANYYQNANAYKDIVRGALNDNSINPTMSR